MSDDPGSKPLPPRRAAFVAAYTDPESPTFGNGTQSAIAAGYAATPAARVESTRLLANDSVSNAVQSALEAAGLTREHLSARLRRFLDDDAPQVRASAVRALELGMRAQRMLDPDVQVSIDARSILLPGARGKSIEELEAMLAALPSAAESTPT